ncbi:MAG: hypothetical protein QOG03_380 [Actinomycetota bacterium]|jgi:hypothetical protein|nr:hypothetical protein [Actinomycetota bacterium]
MTEDQLDELVASASPFTEQQVSALTVAGPERDLLEEIVSTPVVGQSGARRWARRALVPVAAAAVLVGLVAQQQSGGGGTAWAAPVLAVAQSSPRLLVGRPGWKVSRADEFMVDQGEMAFAGEGRQLDVHWQRADFTDELKQDRAASADLNEAIDVAGHPATLFRYAGSTDFTTVWRLGDHTIEARGEFATKADYLDVIGSLHEVGVDTWLEAMPASVVRPSGRAATVDKMLADMPKPPGFDATALRQGVAVKDRYQLGAAVSGSVACGWIDQWVAARASGDGAAVRQAVGAMATSHHWAILQEMKATGDYPLEVWQLADAMANNGTVPGGRPLTIEESYRDGLGCGHLTG